MSFSTISFIYIFLPLTSIIFYFVDKYYKSKVNLYLLIVSVVFYLWNDFKIGIFFILSCSVIYLLGVFISKYRNKKILVFSILVLVLVLLSYKYLDIGIRIIDRVFKKELDVFYLSMPLGLSFALFESISYLVDLYNGERNGNYIDVMLFLMFFAKIAQGPIVTWNKFSYLLDKRETNLDKTIIGIKRIIIGLAKKVIIADVLGVLVSNVVTNYTNVDSITLIGTVLCYMIEIYFDFSGYSDMAIGISKIFGFDFNENFNYPYLSKSIGEFWNRWHISLGNFFKNYLYIPLGGNRKHVYFNLFIVFLISGIWHGNGLGYIAWGIIMGLCVCFERYIKDFKIYKNMPKIFKWIITMTIVYFSWIIFMTPSFSVALNYIKLMFSNISSDSVPFTYMYYFDKRILFTLCLGIFFSLIHVQFKENKVNEIVRYLVLIVLFVISIIYMVNSTYSPFLYFRF